MGLQQLCNQLEDLDTTVLCSLLMLLQRAAWVEEGGWLGGLPAAVSEWLRGHVCAGVINALLCLAVVWCCAEGFWVFAPPAWAKQLRMC